MQQLRAALGRPRPGARLALAAAALAAVVVVSATGAPATHFLATPLRLTGPAEVALTAVVAAAAAGSVALVRVSPWPLLAVAGTAWLAFASWPPLCAASAAVALRPSGRAHLAAYVGGAVALLAVPGAVELLSGPAREWRQVGAEALSALPVTVAVPVLAGMWIRARRAATEALRERAEHAEREQEARARQVRSEERARIAREMHDVVAHRISLIVLQTTAAQVSESGVSPQQLSRIRGAAREALAELREVLGVLGRSDGPAERAPQPSLRDLDALVDQSRAAGVRVDLSVDPGLERLPPVVQRAAYRVVQEGLTNVHKHTGGARTRIRLRHREGRLWVSVDNDRPSSPPEGSSDGGGRGVIGLRQRAELLGGRVCARRGGDGGFTLTAVLPGRVGEGNETKEEER